MGTSNFKTVFLIIDQYTKKSLSKYSPVWVQNGAKGSEDIQGHYTAGKQGIRDVEMT